MDEVLADARRIGYPVLLRPSYVLGRDGPWRSSTTTPWYTTTWCCTPSRWAATTGSGRARSWSDKFLEEAIEIDVDLIGDGERFVARRRDAAHRRGGGALGRQRLLSAAAFPAAGGGRRDQAAERGARPRSWASAG